MAAVTICSDCRLMSLFEIVLNKQDGGGEEHQLGEPGEYWVHSQFGRNRATVGFPGGSAIKNLPAMQETWVRSLGWEDPTEKEMATHSCILVWKIPWAEEPGGLQSMWLQRVRHD